VEPRDFDRERATLKKTCGRFRSESPADFVGMRRRCGGRITSDGICCDGRRSRRCFGDERILTLYSLYYSEPRTHPPLAE